jgi:RNA polymerase sigma-70 factor (ECF subfamily)
VSDSSPSLQHWLDRLGSEDPRARKEARNELLRHSYDRLRLLTRKMLRGFPIVRQKDATSDVLLGALERLDRAAQDVKPPSPRDYLGLAALQIRRELIDRARRYAKEKVAGEPLPEREDSSADPARLASWHDFHCQIADLDDEDRELFDLLYYQGLKQADAARLLGLSLSTFKRRWLPARRRLIQRLGGELPF